MRTTKHTPDGKEIIARQQACGPHPHPRFDGRIVPFNGVTELLLADGTSQFECDHCGAVKDNVKSVVSHMPSHVERGPAYDEETLKSVIRAVIRAKRGKHKNFHEIAAQELNTKGVPTLSGNPWTPGAVSSLYATYNGKYRVRVSGGRVVNSLTTADRDELIEAAAATATVGDLTDLKALQAASVSLAQRANKLASAVVELAGDMAALRDDIKTAIKSSTTVDPEVKRKADAYDAMASMFTGGNGTKRK